MNHKQFLGVATTLAAGATMLINPRTAIGGAEIGFIETFALSPDRDGALRQLIPGTEDYYYYHALRAQQLGHDNEVNRLLEPWVKRYGETPRLWEIRNRQALLRYQDNPKATVDYLRRRLGLSFNHQQERPDAKPEFPARLDPDRIRWERFLKEAFRRSNNTSQLTETGLDRLLRDDLPLDSKRRRDALSRLRYPDYPRLVALIDSDLRSKESRGFGEFPIHRNLLPRQLNELLDLRPELINHTAFVDTWIRKLRPGANENWRDDATEREAYLNRVWDFVKTLPPAFNSLKAHVLYALLRHHERQGRYPRDLFRRYLKLPRPLPYVEPRYLNAADQRRYPVDLKANYSEVTGLPAVLNDEPLVRRTLLHSFVQDDSWEAYAPYLRDTYLKPLFAEAKLTHDLGNPEQWFSLLSPGQVQALKDRVDIEIALDNPARFSANDKVALDVFVKNVGTLTVKVYEINTLNYYLDKKRPLNTDLDLDGLVPNEERAYAYHDPAMRRVRRTFAFDSLAHRRGVWVIEFIGNGISSRALVRKGKLQSLSRTTPAGTAIRVLTQANQPARNPAVWFGGRRYQPEKKDGLIWLPFSHQPGRRPIVLTDGEFATLDWLNLPAENYRFTAGFHVEREDLLPGRKALIAVRPRLFIGGQPASLSLLKSVKLVIRSTDLDGIDSVQETSDFEVDDDREALHAIRVPDRLARLRVELRAQVPRISGGEITQKLSASRVFELNTIDRTPYVADFFLSRTHDHYVVELLGKNGEPRPHRALQLKVWHRDFTPNLTFPLATDHAGQIDLGDLENIIRIRVSGDGLPARSWDLSQFEARNTLPHTRHARAGQVVQLPFPGGHGPLTPRDVALFESRGGTLVENAFDHITLRNGLLELTGLIPGDYQLLLRQTGNAITVRIADGPLQDGYVLSQSRQLEIRNPKPLQIASLRAGDDTVRIQLANAGPTARVHVMATRFLPAFHPADLDGADRAEPVIVQRGSAPTLYISGRDIGDEHRYILARRSARKFPGNMLDRPGLLLNPWALRKTHTTVERAAKGSPYRKNPEARPSMRSEAEAASLPAKTLAKDTAPGESNLNFLRDPAPVFFNLAPDKNGVVILKRADLGDRRQLHVLALDAENAAYRQRSLSNPVNTPNPKALRPGTTPAPVPGRNAKPAGQIAGIGAAGRRDLRLWHPLNPRRHFSQRRKATVLKKGDVLTIPDAQSSEVEFYDTLAAVHAALAAANRDPAFAKFRFVLQWPDLTETRRRELYSRYACHELNFFLARHDPDFFDRVIRPYLANKREKTFLDHYLIGSDLSPYLESWAYGRLNIAERILLARRLGPGELRATARHVRDLNDLIPVTPEQEAKWFQIALRGRGIDGLLSRDARTSGAVKADKIARRGGYAGAGLDRLEHLARRQLQKTEKAAKEPPVELKAIAAAPLPNSRLAMERSKSGAPAARKYKAYGIGEVNAKRLSELRDRQRALFLKLKETREWAENNYDHLPIAQQTAERIPANAFWRDYAAWEGRGEFLSPKFPAATRNFAEMMLALAVLDLPFKAAHPDVVVEDHTLTLKAGGPMIVFHEQIEETPVANPRPPILVSQNFFRYGDRVRHDGGKPADHFVTGELLTGVLYGCRIGVTNPTSETQQVEVLLQIPRGAIPAYGGEETRSLPIRLEPFSTQKLSYFFYFPSPSGPEGFEQYPVQVSREQQILAWAAPARFQVVDRLSTLDKTSWDSLSQYGSEDQVLDFLRAHNLYRVDLDRIAWRCRKSADFLRRAVALLDRRHLWNATLWSYGLYHRILPIARQYLLHREDFLSQCGLMLECPLVTIDPVDRRWVQQLEYQPLVNPRAHRLGRDRKILNDRFRAQYQTFMRVLSYRAQLNDSDRLGVAYYLFLQDRIGEGLAWLDQVHPASVETHLQLDYLQAYAALYRDDRAAAARIAAKYTDYPVNRWRERFAKVTAQLSEIRNAAAPAPDAQDREARQDTLAATEPAFDMTAKGRTVTLTWQNLRKVRFNLYEMDLEFLFSSNPFVTADTRRFSYVKPNFTLLKSLPAKQGTTTFEIPARFTGNNVLVEIVGAGRKQTAAVYANALRVQVLENYGRLQVRHARGGEPMSRVYVKVYARFNDGRVRFFKDGYTDLRGKFDYVSLNTAELDNVNRLSLLVMSERDGALVRQVAPPRR